MKNLYFGYSVLMRVCTGITLLCFLTVTGCTWFVKKDNEEAMLIQASALTKLSTAVEATVNIDEPDESVSDEEILRLSTEDEPMLLEPFKDNVIKINREFGHAILLVCSADGAKGLLEDAGCTAKMDEYLWKKKNACEFTISSASLCQ